MSRDLTCREVVELLSDYLDDALGLEQRADVDAHLADCDGCTRVLDQLRETIRLTGTLAPEELTAEQRAMLVRAFRHHMASD